MSAYPIRPHHLLCLYFFEGKGYSPAFVENMTGILRRLEQDASVTLTPGADAVCAVCPHNNRGICQSQDKVLRYDEAVLAALDLTAGETAPWQGLRDIAFHRLIQNRRFLTICGDCEWAAVCAQKAGRFLRDDAIRHYGACTDENNEPVFDPPR